MSLNSVALGVAALIAGIFIGKHLDSVGAKDSIPAVQVAQNAKQKQGVKCTVTKTTKASGESEEKFEAVVDSSNTASNEVKIQPQKSNSSNISLGLAITRDLNLLPAIGVKASRLDFEAQTDFKKDHRASAKFILLEW